MQLYFVANKIILIEHLKRNNLSQINYLSEYIKKSFKKNWLQTHLSIDISCSLDTFEYFLECVRKKCHPFFAKKYVCIKQVPGERYLLFYKKTPSTLIILYCCGNVFFWEKYIKCFFRMHFFHWSFS